MPGQLRGHNADLRPGRGRGLVARTQSVLGPSHSPVLVLLKVGSGRSRPGAGEGDRRERDEDSVHGANADGRLGCEGLAQEAARVQAGQAGHDRRGHHGRDPMLQEQICASGLYCSRVRGGINYLLEISATTTTILMPSISFPSP